MYQKRKQGFKPFPELVEPFSSEEPWKIEDTNTLQLPSNGAVDHRRRWMAVPLDPSGRPVSRHELAHVAWSPPHLPRVRFDARVLAVVEDARINRGLDVIGIPVYLDQEMCAHVRLLAARDAKRNDTFAMVARATASIGTNLESDLTGSLGGEGCAGQFALECVVEVRAALERAEARSAEGIAPFKSGVRIARTLARKLQAEGLLDSRGRAKSSIETGCCALGHGEDEGDEGACDRGAAGAAHPGEMEIVRAPMPVRLRSLRGAGRSFRAATEGSVVRSLTRWPTDKAIFRRRRSGHGGASVLVDTSGSMSIEVSDLDRLLLATPAGARVAIYSATRRSGELRIIAHRNRRALAADLEPYGRANVVDVPALEWLAKQPGPRLWVSDGKVTGIGDQPSEPVTARVAEICRSARIERVATLEVAADRAKARQRS